MPGSCSAGTSLVSRRCNASARLGTGSGFGAGLVGVAAGFVAYDFFSIPPYKTLAVGAAQNWVALGVYVVVLVVVSRVVSRQRQASEAARRREEDARKLFFLSELLLGEDDLGRVLQGAAEVLAERLALASVEVALSGPTVDCSARRVPVSHSTWVTGPACSTPSTV